MANTTSLGKRELIDKANSTVVATTAIAAFLVVFSLFAAKALWSQRAYQAKVIAKEEKAVNQLNKNKDAVNQLRTSYAVFNGTPDNVIGGNPNGTGDKDGQNAKIVLDALPSKYDFPAFITSVQKLLKTKNFKADSISGTDDEIAQSTATASAPVEIPFQLTSSVNGYSQFKDFLTVIEKSIRPIKVNKLTVTGGDGSRIQLSVDAVSYYQKAKGLTITKEVVK